MLQDELNKVIEYVAGSAFSEDVYKAKKEYQKVAGDIFEDDESFDTRMATFLEWYTLDRIPDNGTKTPLLEYIEKFKDEFSSETLKTYNDFTNNIYGIFIVKKIKSDHVVILNLFDIKKYKVKEKQSEIIFHKNDIFQGRIVLYQGEYLFTGNNYFHPQKALKVIKSGIEQLDKDKKSIYEELKILEKEKSKLLKDINSFDSKIEQKNHKVKKSRSLMETASLDEKRRDLEVAKGHLEIKLAKLDEKITYLNDTKIKREIPKMRNRLLQRFLYLNLKWERFRQIDIKDIYRI